MRARRPLRAAITIVAGWTLIAAIWTPPSVLVAEMQRAPASWNSVFLQVFLSFVPWMVATPWLLWLGRRFPIAEGSVMRNLALHAGIGVPLIPLLAVWGQGLVVLLLPLPANVDLPALFGGAMITALYSAPTYVAVVGIGQALAYLERYRMRERLLARAQLQALQAQIHPHFLFNALNAIAALGYRDPARADRALTELSDLLRLSLKDGPEHIPLRDEVAFAQGCVALYALLMPAAPDWQIDIEAEAWNARVPRMILQPLIENAVVHGLARRAHSGALRLSAARLGGRLCLTLENDDADMPPDVGGEGIGLSNVRERLDVLYGPAQRLELVRGDQRRTRVTVTLPFVADGDMA